MTQQLLTPYQSQYYAWLLTRRAASDTVESLASTLVDSQIDLNPHQIEAALFACRNPLSRGVILADEVGLGKTIEAGLVIYQRLVNMSILTYTQQMSQQRKPLVWLHGEVKTPPFRPTKN